MIRALSATFLAFALVTNFVFAAEEAFQIKTYKPRTGVKIAHETTERVTTTISPKNAEAFKMQETTDATRNVYVEESLELEDDARVATKLTRDYAVSEKTTGGETTPNVYHGKKVAIDKKDGAYEFTIDGRSLTEADAPELFEGFRKERLDLTIDSFFPKNPVRIGEGWILPKSMCERIYKAIKGDGDDRIDADKSSIIGTLRRVYQKDGARFGVIELDVSLLVTHFDLGGGMVQKSDDAKFAMKFTLDNCIDGTLPDADTKFSGSFRLATELGPGRPVEIKMEMTGTEKIRLVK